jgi:hypothetical protein
MEMLDEPLHTVLTLQMEVLDEPLHTVLTLQMDVLDVQRSRFVLQLHLEYHLIRR